MSFEFVRKLPIPSEIKEQYPVPEKAAQIKIERDNEIKDAASWYWGSLFISGNDV